VVYVIELHEIIYLALRNLVLVRIPNGLLSILVPVLSLLELLLEMTKHCRVGETQKPLEFVSKYRYMGDILHATRSSVLPGIW